MSVAASGRVRRTQAERTAETRQALIDATISLLYRSGYSGTTTEAIADEAGVSRGALQYQFPSRAHLMGDVITVIHQQERATFDELLKVPGRGSLAVDWPDLLWELFSKPASLAILELLQASRSDPELAAMIAPIQMSMDKAGLTDIHRFGLTDETEAMAAFRFFVWSIRGLAIAQVTTLDPAEISHSIRFFRRLIESAVATGVILEKQIQEPPKDQ